VCCGATKIHNVQCMHSATATSASPISASRPTGQSGTPASLTYCDSLPVYVVYSLLWTDFRFDRQCTWRECQFLHPGFRALQLKLHEAGVSSCDHATPSRHHFIPDATSKMVTTPLQRHQHMSMNTLLAYLFDESSYFSINSFHHYLQPNLIVQKVCYKHEGKPPSSYSRPIGFSRCTYDIGATPATNGPGFPP
jgi:hypothetical protein